MNCEQLQNLNPKLTLKAINNENFNRYGCIIDQDFTSLVTSYDLNYPIPLKGNQYVNSILELENDPFIKQLCFKVYGGLEVMAGVVVGNNNVLNGIEYHQCSEVIIAITDYVLVVGDRRDMHANDYDTTLCELFYVSKGMVIECYPSTLHYTPIAVDRNGFKTICLLLKGTGDTLINGPSGILKKKNKWFIAHPTNIDKIQAGDSVGLHGDLIKIEIEEIK